MYPLLRPLQRYVLRKAGVVLFTAESTRKEYLECGLVDEQKAVHIPLFYDDSIYKNILTPKDRFIIGYTGQFGAHKGVRSPDVFFEALSLFLTRNPEARKATRFVFHGPWNPIHTPLIRHYTLEDVVEINDPVPYASYLELLEEAVVLLLVASSDQNLFVPGKMLDYFAAKRPILAFVPEDSETRFILKEAGMDDYAADEYDAEGGVRCLERLWKGWASGRILCGNSRAEQWSYSFQMPRILKLFTRK
jgi:glycosyltransferase involved in cell wall biosynthesis